jgi:hypothetical protein
MTTLSVLGLGFAVAGAAPVLAQNYTAAPQPAPPPAATPTPGMTPPTTEQQGTMPAALIPERVAGLVFVNAFVLADGECVFDNVPPDYVALFEGRQANEITASLICGPTPT